MMTDSGHKTEPNRTETVFPLYMGKHVSGFSWVFGTEKTDLNRFKRNLNRFLKPVPLFSKTAFKPI
jgi:hypothetical protein